MYTSKIFCLSLVCIYVCLYSITSYYFCVISTISISLSVSFFAKGDSWDAHEPVFLPQPLHLSGAGGAQALGRWWHGRNFSESEVQFGRPRRVGEVEHEVRLFSWLCNRTTVVVLQVFGVFGWYYSTPFCNLCRLYMKDEHIAEMTNINLSLHTLGKCISALAQASIQRQKVIILVMGHFRVSFF